MKTKRCVFAGTFDPPTLGHKKIVEDCLKIFDGVIVAIMVNPEKTPAYTVEQRKEMLRLTFGENDKIEILEFSPQPYADPARNPDCILREGGH
ncbi:MAG: adenylyltransferase/cytidyltransferase family protein [Clostridia bacterium]|nr:adenylyltransferase/cytidyltransferase family protein [Clostridia bacterium]